MSNIDIIAIATSAIAIVQWLRFLLGLRTP